ncbi:MAG: alpha/beta hydrolase [Oscillospiraceae bacterium]|nr:alpha/beta hydrolase [Oscillospiraceae bacterium]
MSVPSLVLNFLFQRSDMKRDKGLRIPDSVEYIAGLPYGSGLTLDVCYPKGAPEKLPTIVSIHGGGYVYGSAKLYSLYAASLAGRGFAVVNFNYRLAPKYKFPTPLIDTNDAMRWLAANAEEYPLDPENVFLVGDSAGAQLASQYAVIYSNTDYAEIMGLTVPDVTIRALALNCGMYDVNIIPRSSSLMADYFTKEPEKYGKMLDALNYITASYPPTYIMSAPGDFLYNECEPMAAHLRSRGVETVCKIYGDEKTYHVFHLDVRSEVGKTANDDEAKFFMRHIKSE